MNWSTYLSRKLYLLREGSKRKTIVFLISTMRSGSTLLKSLLATAPDISHLPEIDFRNYQGRSSWRLKTLSTESIIVVKKPAAFDDPNYPQLPRLRRAKNIILIRDAYETVRSLRKMVDEVYPELSDRWNDQALLTEYWLPITTSLLAETKRNTPPHFFLRYEDLIQHPVPTTEKLFRFLGSAQQHGVDQYNPPADYKWAWGNDDGGAKIQSFKVQYEPPARTDEQLLKLISSSPEVTAVRQQLGYPPIQLP